MRRSKYYEAIGLAHIGTLLAEALKSTDRIREALGVWPAWEQAVGPQIARAARPIALRDGILLVHVRHPVWMQELVALRATLLRRVRRVATGTLVKELRFKVGKIPEHLLPPPKEDKPPQINAPIPYDVARAIRAIPSPSLRGVLLRVASRWAALEDK